MKELENFTMKEVIDYLTDEVATDRDISKKLARSLVLNAITYNVVVESINNQIDYLLEN